MRVHGVWFIEWGGSEGDDLGSRGGFGGCEMSMSGTEEVKRSISIGRVKMADLDLERKGRNQECQPSGPFLSCRPPERRRRNSHSLLEYPPQKHPT